MPPALSVILPNYNHADYLDKCISAILDQSFQDLELIIIDDASTDDSLSIIRKYAATDPRVRVYQNPENQGVIRTLIRALSYATAEYVMGAASDDYILPGYFENAMALLARHPGAGVCLGRMQCVDHFGHKRFIVPEEWSSEPAYFALEALAAKLTTCGIPGPVIWRREAFLAAGGYMEDLRWHGDWFPLQVTAFRHGVCFVPQICSVVRMAEDSYSANQRKGEIQRPVLQKLFRLMVDPRYRDVLPLFQKSGILRQFGPELIRAAAIDPALPPEMLPLLQEHVFAHAEGMLADPEPRVRAGVAALVGRYGAKAFPLYFQLGKAAEDSDAVTAAAARGARQAIRRSMPLRTLWKHHVKTSVGRVMRGFDWFIRPLHHQRMNSVEHILAESLKFQRAEMYAAMSALYGKLDEILVELKSMKQEIEERETEASDSVKLPRKAA